MMRRAAKILAAALIVLVSWATVMALSFWLPVELIRQPVPTS
jgi:hypothetical protein